MNVFMRVWARIVHQFEAAPARGFYPMSWRSATAALLRGLCAKAAARPKQRSLSYG